MISRDLLYSQLAQIAMTDFPEIVEGTKIVEGKLRILIYDDSFIDVWLSLKKKGAYSYHWERRTIDGTIYRHNNLPDKEARKLETFPKHFHEKSENVVKESHISDIPEEAISSFLTFARDLLKSFES